MHAVRRAGRLLLAAVALALGWACGPSEDRGPVNRLYLDDDEPAGTAGAGAAAGGGAGGEGGALPSEPLVPPSVTAMMPLSGPYGTEVTIEGEGFGNARSTDVRLLLGAGGERELTPDSAPEIVSWSENEIRFRFPFPVEGQVLVETPLGQAVAGEFEPTWLPGPALESQAGVSSIASLAPAPGTLAVVLDTGPPSVVSFDGAAFTETAIPGSTLRAASIRLYLEGSELAAFALSTAVAPVIVALDPASDFDAAPTGVKVTADFHVAGGREGAAIWFRDGAPWSRARPSAGTWSIDQTGVPDGSSDMGKRKVASATSDGSLYVSWAEDVGSITDDRGVAKHRLWTTDVMNWGSVVVSGIEMDDEISNLVLSDRGAGVVSLYCGTNDDPFGVTADERLCYNALIPGGAKATMKETSGLRYAFGSDFQAAVHCSPTEGLRLVPSLGSGGKTPPALDALAGDVVAWPCPNVVALEVDEDDVPLLLVEHAGSLYSPLPRER